MESASTNVVIGIGTGWTRGTPHACNAISREIALTVDGLALEKGSRIFLVGGNGKKDGEPEAQRMKRLITSTYGISTDDSGDFAASSNTPTNAQNIAQYVLREKLESCDIVAVREHLLRVIACVRKELHELGLLNTVEVTGHPIDAPFEGDNAQWQLRSKTYFRIWTLLASAEHLLHGRVLRKEYVKMLLTGKWPVKISDKADS